MRIFNTSGSCDPAKHYTVLRETLIAQGEELVAAGHFFTIFAPRQSGKTTYFQLLFRQLQDQAYTPIWITFESLRTLPREKFYRALSQYLQRALAQHGVAIDYTITDQFDLQDYLERIHSQVERIVLVIDEFEDIPTEALSELLHAFRAMYHQRQYYALHALILVGVSTLAELIVSSASPFNAVDQLTIPYFRFAEVEGLIQQYVHESGQAFNPTVITAIFENTQGQPGLVNGLCQHLVDVVATNRSQPVTIEDFYHTLRYFLTERFDKNILNIVQKAREKQAFMLQMLFDDTPIPFTIIETKIFTDQAYFQKGKEQLADYLSTERVQQGYYVVFSNKHAEGDSLYTDELIEGKQIITYLICTNFEQPSKRRTKTPRKSKRHTGENSS